MSKHLIKYSVAFIIWIISFSINCALGQNFSSIPNFLKNGCSRKSTLSIPPQIYSTQSNGSNIDVIQYVCHWWINPNTDSISGKVKIIFKSKQAGLNRIDLDMASNLVVTGTKFQGGTPTTSFFDNQTLRVNLAPSSLALQAQDSLIIWYRGRPIASPFGSYTRTTHNGTPIIYTLSEPYGAKDWWPCKQSLTDKADSVDFTISSPSAFRGVSNGLLVSETINSGVRSSRWKHKYPCATYLMALAVTNYTHFRQKAVLSSGDTLPIDNYCYPESLASWAIEMAPIVGIMQHLDSVLIPYPFSNEKYGHAQFAFGGGMEHQTISFMENTSFQLQAHELAHHWFGNKVTCGSWKDIWLNEGFATYLAAIEEVHFGLNNWKSIGQSWIDYITEVPDGSVFCTDTTDIYRIFSGRFSYLKGGYLLHMLRNKIGDSAFYAALRNYLNDPNLKFGFAKTQDLQFHLEQTSGQNFDEFFADWFYGQGFPIYNISISLNGFQADLILNQTSSHPSVNFFEGPVPVRFKGPDGDTIINFNHSQQNQIEQISLNFLANSVELDPEKQILARWNGGLVTDNLPLKNIAKPHISPNPAQNKIQIVGLKSLTEIQILDGLGRVLVGPILRTSFDDKIKLNLPTGLYSILLKNEDGVQIQKLIIE